MSRLRWLELVAMLRSKLTSVPRLNWGWGSGFADNAGVPENDGSYFAYLLVASVTLSSGYSTREI